MRFLWCAGSLDLVSQVPQLETVCTIDNLTRATPWLKMELRGLLVVS